MSIRTRLAIALGSLAIGALAAAVPAVATQPATAVEVTGVVQGVNAWTTATQGYSYAEYSVNSIRVSSVNPAFAAAQITPVAAYVGRIPVQQVLLTGSGSQWTVVDAGSNLCDNVNVVTAAVVNDLFRQGCPATSSKATLATQVNGGYKATLTAQRKGKQADVHVKVQTFAAGQWVNLTERRLGGLNGFTWSVVTRSGGGYLTVNGQNRWLSAQVYKSPQALYSVFGFYLTPLGLNP